MKLTAPQSAGLTAGQLRIAKLYGAMDDRRQAEMMEFARLTAQDCPRHKKPTFQLITGGAA